MAVGDNLIHDVIYWQAKTDDGYDFLPAYQAVAPLIQQADLSFINQETPVVAENPPASYPLFNSPVQLADSLQQLGFDIVNLANNHMLDQHAAGLQSTLSLMQEHFEPQGAVIGVNGAVPVVERNGIRFGFAAFTQHTNGIPLPQDKQEMITYTDQTERMRQQVEQAAQIADVAVVSVHWGQENSTTPTPAQRELAQQLADWGADIIIGGHCRVPQPMELRTVTDADGNERTGFICYSLGNMLSCQNDEYTDISALVNIQLTKDTDTGEVWISDVSYKPIYMADLYDYGINDYGWHYRMVDLHAAINSYESGTPWEFITDEVYRDMADALEAVHEFFGAELDSAVKDAAAATEE